jgi:hypothetical protein
MSSIEYCCVGDIKVAHELGKVAVRGREQQVKMVAHADISK